jgi:phage terminase small subunit
MANRKANGNKKAEERKRLFVLAYLKDFNATNAAISAGFSKRSAYSQGSRMLNNVEIQQQIKSVTNKMCEKKELKAENVIDELKNIAFFDLKKAVTWSENGVRLENSEDLAETVTRAISEVSESKNKDGSNFRLKAHDKLKALELLGRYLGIWQDKVEVTTVEPIIITRPSDGSVIELGQKKKGES